MNSEKLVRQFALMGVLFLIIGLVVGRWTTPPKIITEIVTEVQIETQIVRQFIPTNVERECLAKAVFAEARSESFDGQLAVAQVITNRVADARYPNTICGVVRYKNKRTYHFSYQYRKDPNFYKTARVFADMQVNAQELKAREIAYEVADRALDGLDILPKSSFNYHSVAVQPDWADKLTFHKKVGQHLFYTGY